MTLKCPICSEVETEEEVDESALETLRDDVDEAQSTINSLEYVIDEKDETISERDGEINDLKVTVKELTTRISESILGEVDRLKERLVQIRDEKNTIIIEKNYTIERKEDEVRALEGKVIPPHIPFEQYQKYLDERRQ